MGDIFLVLKTCKHVHQEPSYRYISPAAILMQYKGKEPSQQAYGIVVDAAPAFYLSKRMPPLRLAVS
jgi:hypothetical protein